MPKRIQRRMTKNWRKPEGAVYVGRPGRWGNPFKVGKWVTPPVAELIVSALVEAITGESLERMVLAS